MNVECMSMVVLAGAAAQRASGVKKCVGGLEPSARMHEGCVSVLFQPCIGCSSCGGQKRFVALQVGKPEKRSARLALAEEFAGTSHLEVATRNFEAVGGVADGLEALPARGRNVLAEQKDAGALRRAASDAAAKLAMSGWVGMGQE